LSQIGNTTIHTEMTLGTTQVVQGAAQAKVAVEGFKKAAEAPAAQQGVFESLTLGAKAALKPIADVFSLITRSLGIISLITAGVGTLILVVNNLTSAWDRQEKKIKDSEKAVDAYKAKIGSVFLTGEEKRIAEIEARYRELGESIRNDDKLTSFSKLDHSATFCTPNTPSMFDCVMYAISKTPRLFSEPGRIGRGAFAPCSS